MDHVTPPVSGVSANPMAVRPSLICLKPDRNGGVAGTAGHVPQQACSTNLSRRVSLRKPPSIVAQVTRYRCASQKDITLASRNGAAHFFHSTINATQMRIIPRSKKSFLIFIPSATCF
jgi:hypothetical protein